jgi:hypothetical protein
MATPFEGWAVLELLGHRQRPGFVQEVEMAGTKMLRVDIPVGTDEAGQDVLLTEYYSGSSLYALRPCTEAVARDQTKWMSDPRPVRPLDFREREPRRLGAPDPDENEWMEE